MTMQTAAKITNGSGTDDRGVAFSERSSFWTLEDRYELGYELGASWARSVATWEEVKELTSHRPSSWFGLTLSTHHSLVEYAASELDCDVPGRTIRLRREPFTEGLLAGVSAVHDLAMSQGDRRA
jgi:hypothetical protein